MKDADEARRIAARLTDPEARSLLTNLADTVDRMATVLRLVGRGSWVNQYGSDWSMVRDLNGHPLSETLRIAERHDLANTVDTVMDPYRA